jgi:hypothetical protein
MAKFFILDPGGWIKTDYAYTQRPECSYVHF